MLMAMARYTKGKASPSLSPASDVRPNRTSSSLSVPSSSSAGSPTCTSEARTGSVGARPDATSSAAPRPRPRNHSPSSVSSRMHSGMAIPRRRHVVDQPLRPRGRSSARPAPIRETITQISDRCRTKSPCARGSGSGSVGIRANAAIPDPRKTIGMENGMFRSSLGSTAATKTATPATAKRMLGASNTRCSPAGQGAGKAQST
ncbi:hypothetical protein QE394_001349 [Arthrobacter sp. SORGH_AS 212]|nr:hypothetical protein [Arthrobacter sp. SORGH_AS_0212]